MPWHHKLHAGAVLGARELADIGSGASMGIAALSQDLTINGITVAPTFRYEAKNATTGLWTATVGENLTGAGSGGTVGLDTPLLTDDEAVAPETTRYWQASNSSFGQVATEDFVIETVFKSEVGATQHILSSRNAGIGWLLYQAGTGVLAIFIQDNTGAAQQISLATTDNSWYHVMAFVDRSGSAQTYINGIASGTAGSVSARANSLESGVNLTVGANAGGGSIISNNIVYASMWQRDNWLDTHLQAAVAQERFSRLNGSWLSYFSKAPDYSVSRNSVATLTKRTYGQVNKQFLVGAYWPRQESIRDQETDRDIDGTVANSFPYSEDFTQSTWTKTRVSIATGTGVYDHTGKIEMHGIISNAGTNTHYIRGDQSPSSNWKHLVSAEFAAGDTDAVRIQSQNAGAADVWCQFGLRGDGVQGLDSGNIIAAGIEKKASGRWRCWIVYDGGTANHQHRFYVIDDETVDDLNHTGDGTTVNLYITAAQHDYSEQTNGRETLADYVRTVGVGRTTGKPGTGFLVEGQHTNLLTYSDDITNAAWTKVRCSSSGNTGEAPDGETTMDTIVEDATLADTHYIEQAFTQSATAYTFVAVIQAINRSWVQLELDSATDGAASAYFNIAANAVGTESGNDNADIFDLGNGLYLAVLTDTRATAESCSARIYAASGDGGRSFDGLSQDSVRVWGMQVIATPYPVSYIKTSGATVTRLADRLQYDALVLPSNGALAVDVLDHSGLSGTHAWSAVSDGGSSSNTVQIYASNVSATLSALDGGSLQALIQAAVRDPYLWNEFRALYDADNFKILKNGSVVGTPDTSGSVASDLDSLVIGGLAGGTSQPNCLLRVRLFSKPTDKNVTEFE